jgi:hypothetical protein
MVLWDRSRAGCLYGTLIALTIQGMTPDPQDLTSHSISRILQSILGCVTPGAADHAPPADDATDEICTPASAATRPSACDRAEGPSPPHRLVPFPATSDADSPRLQSPREATSTRRRLASLGRFTC